MSRRTQPYRRGAREPGPALDAMLKGRSAGGWNPMDITREFQKGTGRGEQARSDGRPGRTARPPRTPRPPR